MASASPSSSSLPIVIIGGGLAGTLSALLFARRSLPVILIELREDFRIKSRSDDNKFTSSLKRSVNLALSYRGITALKAAGVYDAIKDHLIPMKGRFIHSVNNSDSTAFQAYGQDDEAIYSISRERINRLLLDQLDQYKNIRCIFEVKVSRVESDGTVIYRSPPNMNGKEHSIKSLFVIGADGAFSVTRSSLLRYDRVDYELKYIKHGYKELTIPATSSGDFAISNWQGLHIWPRSDFMLIALPNPDKTFTATLFAPFDGEGGLNSLTTDQDIKNHFNKYFPDVVPIIPNLVQDYKESPSCPLLVVRCSQHHYSDKIVLIGDAAHALVPFLGQGMNCAFDDALYLDELYQKYSGDLKTVFSLYSAARVPAANALADLSLANYREMSHDTASALFRLKKKTEKLIQRFVPGYIPLYSMVQFTRIPYHEAVKKAKKQNQIIKAIGLMSAAATVGAISACLWKSNANQSLLTTIKNKTPSFSFPSLKR